jgi:DNA modification methylase
MNIIEKNIGELINYDKNARVHSSKQIDEIAQSILNFGFNDPIEIDPNNVIISGHARVAAAIKLGLNTVPVIVHEHMDETHKKAYILAANRIAMSSSWDSAILSNEMLDLHVNNFDLNLTGFTGEEINEILNPELLLDGFNNNDENAIEQIQDDVVTKEGDVWLLGDHRLMCGDSTMQDHVDKLLNGQRPNTMITDPPYGVKYEANWRADAKGRKKTEREETSNLMNDDKADWYDAYVLFPGSVAYVWHASAFTDVVMDGLRRAGFEVKQQIIWNKNVHALSRSDYHWKHEPCWYAVKKGAERNWLGGRTQMTVWDVATVQSEKDKTSHPTQKPVEIYLRSINHHTNPGEYIYDPFGGSGTLIIACEKSMRRALTMELDPKFCDVIIRRWQKFTNKKAIHEGDGHEFI